jgi:hypothetical protein
MPHHISLNLGDYQQSPYLDRCSENVVYIPYSLPSPSAMTLAVDRTNPGSSFPVNVRIK